MRAALPRIVGPTSVCTQVGNVNTGAFDPVDKIGEAAHEAGAWLHVAGAFGLWSMAVPSMKELVAGVEGADSWATDFHKWLNVPYDSGLALVRQAEDLRAAMAITAEYLRSGVPIATRPITCRNSRAAHVGSKCGLHSNRSGVRVLSNSSSATVARPGASPRGSGKQATRC